MKITVVIFLLLSVLWPFSSLILDLFSHFDDLKLYEHNRPFSETLNAKKWLK